MAKTSKQIFKVTNGLKCPEDNRGRPPKYPFAEMKVGQHFVAPISIRGVIANCAHLYGRRHNMKFATRKLSDSEVGCWRVS